MALVRQPRRSPIQPPAAEARDTSQKMSWLPPALARFLCRLGYHDFQLIGKTFGFGPAGGVETVECRRCGVTITRQA